jgi:hypothetical protein
MDTPKTGANQTGVNAGAGLLYHFRNRLTLAAGVDDHTVLKGMDV